MAIQSTFYTPDGSSLSYPQTKHIPSKQYVRAFLLIAETNTWTALNESEYDLVYNSIVLKDIINPITYSSMEIRVADNQNELTDNLSDIAVVASIANDITTVASISGDVEIVADNIGSVVTTAGSIASVNTVASNITDVSIVSAAIQGGGSTPTDGGQFYGEGLIRGIQYMAKSIGDSNIVITSDVNAFSIDNIAVGSGGSITVEDGAIFKVL
jgi:hypothetical protein